MIPHTASFAIFNIVINSCMAFITSAILIELIIKIFRIKNPRYQSALKVIPIIKMPMDLIFINWSNWAIGNQIYPWDCPEGTRMLTVGLAYICSWAELLTFPLSLKIGFSVLGGYSFSLADILAYLVGNTWLIAIVCLFVAGTVVRWTFLTMQVCRSYKHHQTLLSDCAICLRPIQNLHLKRSLEFRKASIVVRRGAFGSPYLAGIFKPVIVFPETLLDTLEQKEYEAVIAHELEHTKKNDPLMKGIIQLITHLFWWVPMGWMVRSVEITQEMDCDRASFNYASPSQLASAFIKVAKQSLISEPRFGIPLLRRSLLTKRITALYDRPIHNKWPWPQRVTFSMGVFFALTILLGKLWEL